MEPYICLLNNCTRYRGNPSLGTSGRAKRGHSGQDSAVGFGWFRLCKTDMLFPGISLPVEICCRYMASWKMTYIETHQKGCSRQLGWCHLSQRCNCSGREKLLPFVFAVSARWAVLTEWPRCHHWWCGQANKQTSVLLDWRRLAVVLEATSGGRRGLWVGPQLLQAMTAGFAGTDQVVLAVVAKGALRETNSKEQRGRRGWVILLASAARAGRQCLVMIWASLSIDSA